MSGNTQNPSTVPMSTESCKATGSAQWLLENKVTDANILPFNYNNLNVYICGEDAFRRIADDIQHAELSVDIICWGFDPAMELTRDSQQEWPRGDTWGGLLRDATQGKLKSGKKVQVSLLCWYDTVGQMALNNMPGYKKDAPYELKAASLKGIAAGASPYGQTSVQAEPTEPRDRREVFNAHWYKDVVAGRLQGVALRTRGGVHEDVIASLKLSAQGNDLGLLERPALEYLATHHQKTIVIDYEGAKPCAYVMGLNSVTDYWDTKAHKFDEPKRGKSWEGSGGVEPGLKPFQDYACRIEGEALVAVAKNFTEAWNKAHSTQACAGADLNRSFDFKNPPLNLKANLVAPLQRAQIVRTVPDQEVSIERLYKQATSFARHYLYLENQYFQYTAWAKELKAARVDFVTGCQSAKMAQGKLTKLHVMVVIPTPERSQMVPRTHDTVTELGHGSSMPGQEAKVNEELLRHEKYERDYADYETKREAHNAQRTSTSRLGKPTLAGQAFDGYPMAPPIAPPLSDIAKTYKAAGGGRAEEDARKELEGQMAMRTLVASLWTHDPAWAESKFPVFAKVREEQRMYAKAQEDFTDSRQLREAANSMPPKPPPSRKKEIDKAQESRYREIYIHSKLMIIDDSMFTLGSANLNLRSFAVDSELNIASDDYVKAKDLRERVWAQHTDGKFGGGVATDQTVMFEMFQKWTKESGNNLRKRKAGESLSCFLVAFHDDRTSSIRLA